MLFSLKKINSPRGFTLVEMLTVLIILSVFVGMFYLVWVTNWSSFEQHITQADLWNDANQIFEQLSFDARVADDIDVSSDKKLATLLDTTGATLAVYRMNSAGIFEVQRGGSANPFIVLSQYVDFNNSLFNLNGKALTLQLSLHDRIFTRDVAISTSVEVYPRN